MPDREGYGLHGFAPRLRVRSLLRFVSDYMSTAVRRDERQRCSAMIRRSTEISARRLAAPTSVSARYAVRFLTCLVLSPWHKVF